MFLLVFLLWNIGEADASYSYVVIDAETGRLLDGSNPNDAMPIASLTKVWTALTVLDNVSLDEEITISECCRDAGRLIALLKGGRGMDS